METENLQKRIEIILSPTERNSLKSEADVAYLAKRISQLVDDNNEMPIWIPESKKWQLDRANDWWLHFDQKEILIINHRYGQSAKLMSAIETMIKWILS